MPGATTARFVVCDFEMPIKLFMMPHTVPNRPTNGPVEPMVARMLVPRVMRCAAPASIRLNSEATRSLMPSWFIAFCERRISLTAAPTSSATSPLMPRKRSFASCKESVSRSARMFRRSVLRAPSISSALASQTDQVTTDAKARPIITALTMRSAAKNIPIGDKSCGSTGSGSTGTGAAVSGAATEGCAEAAGACDAAGGAVCTCAKVEVTLANAINAIVQRITAKQCVPCRAEEIAKVTIRAVSFRAQTPRG